jgi:hypothetical protein
MPWRKLMNRKLVTRADVQALEEYAFGLAPQAAAAGGAGRKVLEAAGVMTEAARLTPGRQPRWLRVNLKAEHLATVAHCTGHVRGREGPEWQKLADRLEALARRLRDVFAGERD